MSLETSISATPRRSAYCTALRANRLLDSPPMAPSATSAPLSVAYVSAIAQLSVGGTNVSHMRNGMSWQLGHIPVSSTPLFVWATASSARPVPWPLALQQLDASKG